MNTLHYKIITPEGVKKEGEARSISAMTEMGEITILPKHIPLVTLLKPGELRVKSDKGEELLAVASGTLEVSAQSLITVLTEEAFLSSELELASIEEAKKRAEEAVKNARNKDDVGFADAAAHLERELAKYRVALKGKGRREKTQLMG